MTGIGNYMIDHHKECDGIFARAEEAVGGADWTRAQAEFEAFARQMDRHFDMEDNLLFPEFEKKTGHAGGPTQVMRMEHDQMRVVMHEMRAALEARDAEQYLGLSETFLVLMQQHNFKEEGILYNMIDQVLGDQVEKLVGLMESTV
jgi:hemerythrin-like domain-containing protein